MRISRRPARDAGIVFIGPSAESIRAMGSKTAARALAMAAGAPVVPGITTRLRDGAEARASAREFGYPVLLKAVGGGGGKGMRRVDREEDLEAAFRDASSEAERAFRQRRSLHREADREAAPHRDPVLGDRHGNMVHLGERECSMQRRHQKVMEECPSPLVAQHPEHAAADGRGGHPRCARRGLLQRRHGGVSGGCDAQFLLPGNEHAAAGGASGDGTGDRARPGAAATRDRGRRDAARCGRRICAGAARPSSAASTRRIRTTTSFRRPGRSRS